MKNKPMWKKILIPMIAVVLVAALGLGIWYVAANGNTEPVNVFQFSMIGMTEYWGDSRESYGPVSTDRIQTVYLSETQTVTEIMVSQGDEVKKGDILMTFDTTLSDLALERARLEVEKKKLQLEDAKVRLWEINSMRPMVIPVPSPDDGAEDENLGTALKGDYQISNQSQYDGSTRELAMICWIRADKNVDDVVLEAVRQQAEIFQKENAEKAKEDAESGEEASGEESVEGTETTPVEPEEIVVNQFYVIFKITKSNMSLGGIQTWQGLLVNRNSESNTYSFRFFDANGLEDYTLADDERPDDEPEIDFGSGFTAAQIAQMRSEQEKTIRDLEFDIKMADAEYKIMQTEASDGNIYSEIDGTVVAALTEEEAKLLQQPILKVSGGGGFYVEGTVSELEKNSLQIDQEVTINDWNTGMVYTGTVSSVGDFPSVENAFNGMGNPNASYYPFTVFVDGSADLQAGSYVSIMYGAGSAQQGVYLENPFLRTEQGKTYVYVRGEDGKLEKRYVTTGKSLWGSYTEILQGVTEEDYIAFPYGRNVKPGAQTAEADLSALYQ